MSIGSQVLDLRTEDDFHVAIFVHASGLCVTSGAVLSRACRVQSIDAGVGCGLLNLGYDERALALVDSKLLEQLELVGRVQLPI